MSKVMSGTVADLLVPSDQLNFCSVIHLNNVLRAWLAGKSEYVCAFMKP